MQPSLDGVLVLVFLVCICHIVAAPECDFVGMGSTGGSGCGWRDSDPKTHGREEKYAPKTMTACVHE